MKTIAFIFMLLATVALFCATSSAASITLTDSERGNSVELAPAETIGFFRYINDRFAYSVDIPSTFTKVIVLPDNDDGLILTTQDNLAQFRASGGMVVADIERALKQSFDEAQDSLPIKAAYATLKKDFWVLSWLEGDVIHYRKYMLRGDTWCDFELSYPTAQKKAYDPVVSHVAKSLTLVSQ
jgi:hypothetical protein